jgi:hypothetical protein
MLETFTHATFAERVGESFRIHPEGAPPLELRLMEATELGGGGGGRRTPFSILFRGPMRPVLPQRIYRLEHEAMGSFELFLVPIGPDGEGMRYEAVFT